MTYNVAIANEELMAEIDADMRDIERQEQAIFEKWVWPEQERKLREEARENMFWSGDEYVREESDTTDFLIEGFLPYTYLAVLGGSSKSGKTCLATALAMAVAKGEPFLGMKTQQSAILWCAYEETRYERLLGLRAHGDVPSWFHVTHEQPRIDNPYDIEDFRWWVEKVDASLIVIDPLFGATRGNLTDGRTARDAMMNLKDLCANTGAAALVVHHINKETSVGLTRDRFAESNQLLATASMDLLMDSRTTSDGAREIRLLGRGRGEFANRTWLMRSEGPAHFELVGDGQTGASLTRVKAEAIRSALAASEAPLTSEEIASVCGQPLQTIRNLIVSMVRDGEIVVVGKDGKSRRFGCRDMSEEAK